jgi:hypothetical protein
MTFAETYREERLINRRSRGRKARIAGRIIGFGLTACLVVALRTDPQLRGMVEDLAMAAIGASESQHADTGQSAQSTGIAALGVAKDSEHHRALETLGIADQNSGYQQAIPASNVNNSNTQRQGSPVITRMPQSRVKINRAGSG